jgi:adenosylhomocysteine nucleosidase
MKIGIIAAMPEEFRAAAQSLGGMATSRSGGLRTGRFSSERCDVFLLESGMGFKNADRAAAIIVRDGVPDLLMSVGFCGAITPELLVGDVVVAKTIVISDESGCDEVPVALSDIGQTFVARQAALGKRVVGGTFVSTAVISSKKRVAQLLSGRYENPVVEMESAAIALVAAEQRIPMLAIRAVSDGAAEELGFTLDEFCDADMRCIRPHKVLLTVLRKPYIIPQLVGLSRSSRCAAENLTSALTSLFPQL